MGEQGCAGIASAVVCQDERAVRVVRGDRFGGGEGAGGLVQQRAAVGGGAGDLLKLS
jgi:hypothetical protein